LLYALLLALICRFAMMLSTARQLFVISSPPLQFSPEGEKRHIFRHFWQLAARRADAAAAWRC